MSMRFEKSLKEAERRKWMVYVVVMPYEENIFLNKKTKERSYKTDGAPRYQRILNREASLFHQLLDFFFLSLLFRVKKEAVLKSVPAAPDACGEILTIR